jgi:hypothetical protein
MNFTQMLYKQETGLAPGVEEELEFSVFRSKGLWVLDISDVEKFELAGRYGLIRFERTDLDYLRWLEEKVEELTRKQNDR